MTSAIQPFSGWAQTQITALRAGRARDGAGGDRIGPALGLEVRFAVLIVCLLTIMGGLAAVAMMWGERGARADHDRHAAIAMAGQTVAIYTPTLLEQASPSRDRSLSYIVQQPEYERAELYDLQGRLTQVEADPGSVALPLLADARAAIAQRQAIYRPADRRLSVTQPLIASGQVVGAVRLVVVRASLPPGPRSDLGALLIAWLAALALGVPAAITMARVVTRPLRALTDFARSISAGEDYGRVDLRTGDEFETLARAFNAMVARFEAAVKRIETLAFRDDATGLPNRSGLQRLIARQVDQSARVGAAGVVFVVRVERLDTVVGMIGDESGKELLGLVGGRLRQRLGQIDESIRAEDAQSRPSQVGRIGEADFLILAPSFATASDAARFAQRIAAVVSEPLEWRDQTFTFAGRVGAAVFPRDGDDPDTLIRQATLAARAASADRRRARFFARDMEKAVAQKLAAERDIRSGIEQRAFVAHFQPKFDLISRQVVGAEALARWIKPGGTIISPARFIGAAEELGLIGPISEAILTDTCWKAAAWAREGDGVRVSVNISPLQLTDDRFTDRVRRTLMETGLAPELLELEITESVALSNPERAATLLTPLKEIGVSIALDDFGCGHSSLASLSRLPFDVIKIDQQFVRALSTDPHAPAIIETILTLADRMGCAVVAEGVETEFEAEWLIRHGCRIAQGFLFGPAMAPAEFRRAQLEARFPAMRPPITPVSSIRVA